MVICMREMKDSGIEWIGEIPKNWEVGQIKHHFDVTLGKMVQSEPLSASETYENYLCAANIKWLGVDTSTNKQMWFTPSEKKQYLLQNGDVVVMEGGTAGTATVYSNELSPCYMQNSVNRCRSKDNYLNKFLYYWLYHVFYVGYIPSICNKATIMHYTKEKLERTPILTVPSSEQRRIVAFLDSKCAEIDALSADIQSEIDTLESYKRSKVFDTVMHGIDHNSFVQTDSDVWSTIPVGWKLIDIKYLFEIVKRIAGKEGYDIIAITQQGLKYKDISSNEGQLASDYSGYQFVYPGDYAMNHMDLLTGWVDLSDKFGVTSPDYRVFRLRYPDAYDREYYKYVMQCCYMNRIFYTLGQGVSNLGRWRLQTSAFNNFKVPVPPYAEQVRLGQYLENEISQINEIIAQKQEQLAVLADYKKSVIYEYVTGKKEVPVA